MLEEVLEGVLVATAVAVITGFVVLIRRWRRRLERGRHLAARAAGIYSWVEATSQDDGSDLAEEPAPSAPEEVSNLVEAPATAELREPSPPARQTTTRAERRRARRLAGGNLLQSANHNNKSASAPDPSAASGQLAPSAGSRLHSGGSERGHRVARWERQGKKPGLRELLDYSE